MPTPMTDGRFDVCVVGAGLVGLSVARALAETHRGIALLVVDKDDRVAAHQSSHNSGVVHSGLYYRPDSLKARLCVEGRREIEALGAEGTIPYRRTGKLVIASHRSEVAALDELERRGRANGLVGLERVGAGGIAEVEPNAVGVDALLVPEAGVADFPALAEHLASRLRAAGATISLGAPVRAIEHGPAGVTVETTTRRYIARVLVNCAGLQSDLVARMAGVEPPVRIVPFRGEYYRMADESAGLVQALIYPVPDPRFPFLGVHFTRRIDGTVEVGPNAVPAIGREHYRDAARDWKELRSTLRYRGFRRLAWRHWRSGLAEIRRSRSPRRYARSARLLVPAVRASDLLPGGVGVRAQALSSDGSLVDDFVIERAGSTLHVLNAPSPGATASLAIGRHVAATIERLLRG